MFIGFVGNFVHNLNDVIPTTKTCFTMLSEAVNIHSYTYYQTLPSFSTLLLF